MRLSASPSLPLPHAACLHLPTHPHSFILLPKAGWLLPLARCECCSCKTQEQSCNHVTYLSCWLLRFTLRLFGSRFSSTFWDQFCLFVCFFLYLFHHPSISLNIGISWSFVLIVLSFSKNLMCFYDLNYNARMSRTSKVVSCVCLSLVPDSRTGAGWGKGASYQLLQSSQQPVRDEQVPQHPHWKW